jgi:hypothetical protein
MIRTDRELVVDQDDLSRFLRRIVADACARVVRVDADLHQPAAGESLRVKGKSV